MNLTDVAMGEVIELALPTEIATCTCGSQLWYILADEQVGEMCDIAAVECFSCGKTISAEDEPDGDDDDGGQRATA